MYYCPLEKAITAAIALRIDKAAFILPISGRFLSCRAPGSLSPHPPFPLKHLSPIAQPISSLDSFSVFHLCTLSTALFPKQLFLSPPSPASLLSSPALPRCSSSLWSAHPNLINCIFLLHSPALFLHPPILSHLNSQDSMPPCPPHALSTCHIISSPSYPLIFSRPTSSHSLNPPPTPQQHIFPLLLALI